MEAAVVDHRKLFYILVLGSLSVHSHASSCLEDRPLFNTSFVSLPEYNVCRTIALRVVGCRSSNH